jgi:hypothetical protein
VLALTAPLPSGGFLARRQVLNNAGNSRYVMADSKSRAGLNYQSTSETKRQCRPRSRMSCGKTVDDSVVVARRRAMFSLAPLAPDRRSRSFPVHDQTLPCASHPAQALNGWYKPHRRSLALHPRYLRHGSHVGVPALRIQSSNATLRVHMALNEACPRAAGAPALVFIRA